MARTKEIRLPEVSTRDIKWGTSSEYQINKIFRHARREAQIQKSIKHSKIIRLYDVFDVDINT